MGGNWTTGAAHAAVAYNSADNEYLVVWHGDDDTPPLVDDEWEIFGQRYRLELDSYLVYLPLVRS